LGSEGVTADQEKEEEEQRREERSDEGLARHREEWEERKRKRTWISTDDSRCNSVARRSGFFIRL